MIKVNYSYPLDSEWSTEEIVKVVDFLQLVEQSYEGTVDTKEFLKGYKKFKEVVPSIGEEKKLSKVFEKASGYSLYQAVKAAKTNPKRLKLG